jgi:hypothetical protein
MLSALIPYYAPPDGRPPADVRPDFTSIPLADHPVTITDMRSHAEGFALEREGFTLADAPTAVRNFYDKEELARVYLREAADLVRSLTGCAATAVMNAPLIRVSGAPETRPLGTAPTGDLAHADVSASSAEFLLRRSVRREQADDLVRHRYALFNVWRAFSGPPQDMPLALCDTRTVEAPDKQHCFITMRNSLGDTVTWNNIAYRHSPRHRWWYCRDMRRDEALVFRSFDSHPAHAEQVPHSAFHDATCPADVPPRASVEVRVFAFFKD